MSQKSKKESDEITFKQSSVDLLLSVAKAEYDNEHNRTSIIDTKASIALPIISGFVLALVQMNNYKSIFTLPSSSFAQWIIPAFLFFSYTCSLATGLTSVFFLTKVILTREYITLKIRDLYDEDYLKDDSIPYSIQISKLYCESSEHNKDQNDLRVKWYKTGWILVFISLLSFVFYSISNNLFL